MVYRGRDCLCAVCNNMEVREIIKKTRYARRKRRRTKTSDRKKVLLYKKGFHHINRGKDCLCSVWLQWRKRTKRERMRTRTSDREDVLVHNKGFHQNIQWSVRRRSSSSMVRGYWRASLALALTPSKAPLFFSFQLPGEPPSSGRGNIHFTAGESKASCLDLIFSVIYFLQASHAYKWTNLPHMM